MLLLLPIRTCKYETQFTLIKNHVVSIAHTYMQM